MSFVLPIETIGSGERSRVGGKGFALARLAAAGFELPITLVLSTDAYDAFVDGTGLRERVQLELHRKDFKEMRWEEIWDCALRIRNMFLKQAVPEPLAAELVRAAGDAFADRPVAVRSSAPDEDAAGSSFAGLHESFINVRGVAAILDRIRLVWASLWSDAALLYRQELGLDPEKSTMALVLQETVVGRCSGVVFSRNPSDESQAVIEAVHGLNQGLVDGQIEPDRWFVDRSRKSIAGHHRAERRHWMVAAKQGVRQEELPRDLAARAPLDERSVLSVYELALKSENLFDCPQDLEWTLSDGRLVTLQSRPITTLVQNDKTDRRSWYLSLHRSFENLKALRRRIEQELIPGMESTAQELAAMDLEPLSDGELSAEIRRRWQLNHRWANTYWSDFIPYAHGIRLFGQVYNDALRPEDPYEFMDLLVHRGMASLERNRQLQALADEVGSDRRLKAALQSGDFETVPGWFQEKIDAFIERYGDLTCSVTGARGCLQDTAILHRLLLQMAMRTGAENERRRTGFAEARLERLLDSVGKEQRPQVLELLEVARSSYRLRDDDNIYLGRIEAQLLAAVQEARRRMRLSPGAVDPDLVLTVEDLPLPTVSSARPVRSKEAGDSLKARQLTGQPAGPGLARGPARVIHSHGDLQEFRSGDVLVCDAVDPNMTFVVPLAAAVVERRGGMLIHGAIIAREYGLPCVTGIADAASVVQTGDLLTVDGYLGIVTIGTGEL